MAKQPTPTNYQLTDREIYQRLLAVQEQLLEKDPPLRIVKLDEVLDALRE